MNQDKSYARMLNSTAIIGGSSVITVAIGFLRTKFAAVFIGAEGIGLVTLLTTFLGLVGTVAGFGVQLDAVREIAEATNNGNSKDIDKIVPSLKRFFWGSGSIAMAIVALFSPWLGVLLFGDEFHAVSIISLSTAILFNNVFAGKVAVLQGLREIKSISKINMLGALIGTAISIPLYGFLGMDAVVPVLVFMSLSNLLVSLILSHAIRSPACKIGFREALANGKMLAQRGLPLMWASLGTTFTGFFANVIISEAFDLKSVGIYAAALTLSGVFVNLLLNSLGTDYYPSLARLAGQNDRLGTMVNEQTEINVLLGIPGLTVMILFAPWIIKGLYTEEFLAAKDLLEWFVAGCFIRMIQWPMGFLQLALGKKMLYMITQTSLNMFYICLVFLGVAKFGLVGASVAFFGMYLIGLCLIYCVAVKLIGFGWSNSLKKQIFVTGAWLILCLAASRYLDVWPLTIFGFLTTPLVFIIAVRCLLSRLGDKHKLVRTFAGVPFIGRILVGS